jgi:hypothetical protein
MHPIAVSRIESSFVSLPVSVVFGAAALAEVGVVRWSSATNEGRFDRRADRRRRPLPVSGKSDIDHSRAIDVAATTTHETAEV